MTPTRLAAGAFAALAVAAPFVAPWLVLPAALVVVSAVVVDALLVREPPRVIREVPRALVRGASAPLRLRVERE